MSMTCQCPCDVHDYYGDMVNAVEVISIQMNSIHHINRTIPPLPKGLGFLQGEKLPNGNFLVCGGLTGGLIVGGSRYFCNEDYLIYKNGSDMWDKVGKMKERRYLHSSVFINGRLFSCGGLDSNSKLISDHEAFTLNGKVKKKKSLPIALAGHTASKFDENKILVCGGRNEGVSGK